SGGALAVENALKVAFDWKVRKNFKKGYVNERGHKVIHFREAFHGRTGYTLSLTNTHDLRKIKYFPKFDWPRIDNPKIEFPLNGENLEKVKKAEKKSIKQIYRAIDDNPDDIAAIIIEPIQGEGGDNHFRNEFFVELRRIADEHEIMLIMDEVQTGVGLTGKMWAYQHFDFVPDIIAFGKKTQVCGIICNNRVEAIDNNVFQESNRLNSTWGGNLVDMVRFSRYLEIIDEENLVENARVQGEYLLEKLNCMGGELNGKIKNIRGRGLMAAFDVSSSEERDKIRSKIYENGVAILGCGQKTIRFRPPLNINRNEIDEGLEIISKTLREFYH
ncbi:MAG: aminotransferase class III-fold pyridoxal phosphate-dependent enzyme, partial [Fidelibacterota bacterium]